MKSSKESYVMWFTKYGNEEHRSDEGAGVSEEGDGPGEWELPEAEAISNVYEVYDYEEKEEDAHVVDDDIDVPAWHFFEPVDKTEGAQDWRNILYYGRRFPNISKLSRF